MRYYLKQKPPDTVLFQSKKYRVRVVFIYTEVVGCLKLSSHFWRYRPPENVLVGFQCHRQQNEQQRQVYRQLDDILCHTCHDRRTIRLLRNKAVVQIQLGLDQQVDDDNVRQSCHDRTELQGDVRSLAGLVADKLNAVTTPLLIQEQPVEQPL